MVKNIKLVFAVTAIGLGLAVFTTTLTRAVWYAPDEVAISVSVPQAPVSTTASPSQWPVRISIPSLRISANVQSVGVSKKGTMAVPTNYSDAAWYKGGTVPGQVGSAVFNGHVDNGFGLAGVFKKLNDVKEGDKIIVEALSGKKYTYVVERTATYPYQLVPNEEIFNADDAARLNIITCSGAWIAGEETYENRLVVYAKLWSSE